MINAKVPIILLIISPFKAQNKYMEMLNTLTESHGNVKKTWSRQLFTTTHDMNILNGIYGTVIQMVSMVSN